MLTLYDYYRSTACYRVRIALNIKALEYNTNTVHLVHQGGEQHRAEYAAINPQKLVPALDVDGHIISQSLAIIEYLDETWPNPPLLPEAPLAKALVRSLALTIACDIHPLNNLRVTQYLRKEFKAEEPEIITWYHHWLKQGFDAFEKHLHKLSSQSGFCYGTQASLADICLIPQVYNAQRFAFDMEPYPLIQAVNDHCLGLEAFKKAAPEI